MTGDAKSAGKGVVSMIGVRQILRPANGRVTIEIPADFADEDVEVIVMPAGMHEMGAPRKRMAGLWKGQIQMAPDFDEPLEDFGAYSPFGGAQ